MFLAAVALRAVVGVVILTWCDTQSIAREASHQMSVQCLGVWLGVILGGVEGVAGVGVQT